MRKIDLSHGADSNLFMVRDSIAQLHRAVMSPENMEDRQKVLASALQESMKDKVKKELMIEAQNFRS